MQTSQYCRSFSDERRLRRKDVRCTFFLLSSPVLPFRRSLRKRLLKEPFLSFDLLYPYVSSAARFGSSAAMISSPAVMLQVCVAESKLWIFCELFPLFFLSLLPCGTPLLFRFPFRCLGTPILKMREAPCVHAWSLASFLRESL